MRLRSPFSSSRLVLVALTLLVLLAACGNPTAAQPYRPQVGQKHADFTLPNTADGQPVSLSDYRGKKVLLIHFASW